MAANNRHPIPERALKPLSERDLKEYLHELGKYVHEARDSQKIMDVIIRLMTRAYMLETPSKVLRVLISLIIAQSSILSTHPSHILSHLTESLKLLLRMRPNTRKYDRWIEICVVSAKALGPHNSSTIIADMMSILELSIRTEDLYPVEILPDSTTAPPQEQNKSHIIEFTLWQTLSDELAHTHDDNIDTLAAPTTEYKISCSLSTLKHVRHILTQLCANLLGETIPSHGFMSPLGTPFSTILSIQMKYGSKSLKYQTLRVIRNMMSSEGGLCAEFERTVKHLIFVCLKTGARTKSWPQYRDEQFDDLLSEILIKIPSNLSHYDYDSGILPHLISSTFEWNIQHSKSIRFKKHLAGALHDITLQGGFTPATLISLFECISDNDIKDKMIHIYQNLVHRFHREEMRKRMIDDAFAQSSDQSSPRPLKKRKINSTGASLTSKSQYTSNTQHDRVRLFFGDQFNFGEHIQEFAILQKKIETKQLALDYIEPLLHVFQQYINSGAFTLLMEGLQEHINNQSANIVRNHESDSDQSLLIISCVKILSNKWSELSPGNRKNIIGYLEKILRYHQVEVLPLLVSLPRNVGETKLNVRNILIESLGNTNQLTLVNTALQCIPTWAKLSDASIINDFHPMACRIAEFKGENRDELVFELVHCLHELLKVVCCSTSSKHSTSAAPSFRYYFDIETNFARLFFLLGYNSANVRSEMVQILRLILEYCPEDKLIDSKQTLENAFHQLRTSSENHEQIRALFSYLIHSKKISTVFDSESLSPLIMYYIGQIQTEKDADLQIQYMDILSAIAQEVNGASLQIILFHYLDCFENPTLHTRSFEHVSRIAALRGKESPKELFTGDLHDDFFEEWLPSRISTQQGLIEVVVRAVFDSNLSQFTSEWFFSIVSPLIANEESNKLEIVALLNGKNVVEMCESGFRSSLSVIVAHLAINSKSSEDFVSKLDFLRMEVLLQDEALIKIFPNALKYSMFHVIKRAGRVTRSKDRKHLRQVIRMIESHFKQKVPLAYDKKLLREQFFEITDSLFSTKTFRSNKQSQKRALVSFHFLMKEMGQETINLSPKIMSTLRTTLKKKELTGVSLKAYFLFLKLMGPAAAPHLREIFVSIIPFLQKNEVIAKKILTYLIDEQSSWTEKQFENLPELPHTPFFEPFRQTISDHVGEIKLEKRLMMITDMLRDQTLPVQCFALKQLRDLLRVHHSDVKELILSGKDHLVSSEQKPLFSDLMTELLKSARAVSMDKKANLDAAECLGLLGAIDSSYLHDVTIQKDRFRRVSDEQLVKVLLKKCHIYLTGDLHDIAAYSIQEYLHILKKFINSSYKITCIDESERKLLEQLEPYERTRFEIKDTGQHSFSTPVYRESEPTSIWLKHWAYLIIHKLKEHDPTPNRLKVLEKSYNMMRDDEIAIFVMTYLIDFAISSSVGVDAIVAEINHILNHCVAHPDNVEVTKGHIGTIFQLLDNLQQLHYDSSSGENSDANAIETLFFDQISKVRLSEAAHSNKAYARAYMYLEAHLKKIHVDPKYDEPRVANLKIEFSLEPTEWRSLIDLYRHLDESDGFYGFSSLHNFQLGVADQLLLYQGQAEWNHALDCYEQALTSDFSNDATTMTEGVLDCMRNLGHLKIMLRTVEGSKLHGKSIQCYGVQAAWRLNDWDSVETYLHQVKNPPIQQQFECQLSRCLLAFAQDNDYEYFQVCLKESRKAIMPSLRVACAESYTRAYPYLVQLQMLSEIDRVFSKIHEGNTSVDPKTREHILTLMTQGINITKDAVPIKEQLLSLRRVLFSKLNMQSEIGNSWVKWAKVCRKATHYHTAHSAILQAMSYPSTKCFIEKAKLFWEMGDQNTAIKEVESRTSVNERKFTQADLKALNKKMRLLAVIWNEKTHHQTHKDTIQSYENLVRLHPDFEDAQFHFGLFLDQFLLQKLESSKQNISSRHDHIRTQSKSDIIAELETALEPLVDPAVRTVKVYAASLKHGNKNMFHAMPRMLAVFFDTVEKCLNITHRLMELKSKTAKKLLSRAQKIVEDLCDIISVCADEVAPFKWYSFVDQMNNGWLRKHSDKVTEVIREILTKLMVSFPEQTIWHLMYDLNKSRDSNHVDQFMEQVLQDAASEDKEGRVSSVKNSAHQFYDKFSKFAKDFSRDNDIQARLDKAFAPFRHLVKQGTLNLIVPTHDFLYLPQGSNISENDPFRRPPIIVGMAKKFSVMNSQAKPRKIVFHGELHDQRGDYPFLVKPRDDLRKDQRVMHFFSMVNRLIQNDPDSKRRKLKLNTFSCLPLAPNQGIVEWVIGTSVMAERVHEQYKKDFYQKVVRDFYYRRNGAYETTVDVFEKKIQPAFPPRFSRFFSMNFSDPAKWFEARLSFCRSCATYSIVGALIGLGDRHLENILLLNTGEVVHIDFDCLFEKGKKLAIAEQVPFRLTSNLVDGMGINQFEGVFRRTATIILSLMRKNRDAITTIFRAFINDFTKGEKKGAKYNRDYHKSDPGLFDAHFKRIEGMLDGFTYAYDGHTKEIKKTSDLPLSVSGQVDRLILQATSTSRLCNMYVWWLPFV
mmetsp:Transcript_2421/g.9105  ORF Transcript_2421/g.9105 Transcript_2421/m.9105 type:complete len:2544 (-) Transcript_2421:94-7725(-)